MTEENLTRWRCDRCKTVEEVPADGQPSRWARLGYAAPPRNATAGTTKLADLCADCWAAVQHFIHDDHVQPVTTDDLIRTHTLTREPIDYRQAGSWADRPYAATFEITPGRPEIRDGEESPDPSDQVVDAEGVVRYADTGNPVYPLTWYPSTDGAPEATEGPGSGL